jgi:hypothetical protein
MKNTRAYGLLTMLCACAISAAEPQGTVLEVMTLVITPATNTIWGVEDPRSDEEWQVYIDAAEQLIAATTRIKAGGTGPNDPTWAANPAWQQFADALIESGREVRAAAEARDLDTMINASNDKMYPPCEECHAQFHPGLQQ